MKSRFSLFFVPSLIVCACTSVHGADVTSVANGAWNVGATWSDGLIPASGKTYEIDGENVNTPNLGANGSHAFPGTSLLLSSGELQLKVEHNAGGVTGGFTIPSFTMAGGSLIFDASNGTSTWNFESPIAFAPASTSKLIIRDGNFGTTANINNAITGSGNIVVESNRSDTNDDRAYLYLKSADSTFSGNWSAQGFDTGAFTNIRAAAARSLGTGTVTLLDRGSLLVDVDQGIDGLAGVTLNHPSSRFNLNRNWSSPTGILTVTDGTASIGRGIVNIASLSQAAGTINLSVGGVSDGKIITSANASFTGGTLAVTLEGNPVGKAFDLITYVGSLTGTPSYSGDSGRLTPTLDTGSGSNDTVSVSFSGSVADLVWTGANNDNWNNNSTLNFTNAGSPDVFRSFDNVLFDDSTTFNSPILIGALNAGTITFSGASDYTLSGTGNLVGNTAIVKNGTHLLTVANTTANTFSGPVTINGGILKAGIASALGSTTGDTTIGSGGTLDINAQNLGAELVRIAGTGVGGNGTIINTGASQSQALRFVTLTADATIGGPARWDIRANATATLNLAGHKLTKTGDSYIAIVGSNITSGDIDVNQGTLAISTTSTLQGTGTLAVNPGGALEFGFTTLAGNITRNITLNGGSLLTAGGASAANSNITLTADSAIGGTGTLTLAGNIGQTGGDHAITKSGDMTLALSGENSYSGGTTITLGQVNVTSNTAFGTGPVEFLHSTATTTTTRANLVNVTLANDFILNSNAQTGFRGPINTGVGNTLSTLSGTISIQSNVGNGGHFSSLDGGVLRLTGTINTTGPIPNIRSGTVEMGTTGGNLTQLSQGEGTLRLVADNGIQPSLRLNMALSAAGILDLNGFDQSLAELRRNGTFTATVTNTAASTSALTIAGTVDHTFSGLINDGTGGISLVKAGTSTLTLTSSNTYTGTTTVNGGRLLLNASHASATGAITVNSGGTLGGTSTVGGAITVKSGGTLAPGAGVGTLTTNSQVTLETGSIFAVEINSSTGNSADQLFANDDVSITGAILTLADIASSPAPIPAGTKLVLIDYGPNPLTGTFTGLAEGAPVSVGTNNFTISYNDDSRVTLTATAGSDPYLGWATTSGLDGTPGKEAGFDADPDNDGIPNGLEWILGGDPLDGASGSLITSTATASGGLTLTFDRNEDAIGNSTLSVEYSATLTPPWNTATVGATSSGPDANGVTVTINTASTPDQVTINIPASNADGGRVFARIKATKP